MGGRDAGVAFGAFGVRRDAEAAGPGWRGAGEAQSGCRDVGLRRIIPCGRVTRRERLPPGDNARAGPSVGIVGDAWEETTDLDGRRQLALLLVGGADRGGFGFTDTEHLIRSMGTDATTGKWGARTNI